MGFKRMPGFDKDSDDKLEKLEELSKSSGDEDEDSRKANNLPTFTNEVIIIRP